MPTDEELPPELAALSAAIRGKFTRNQLVEFRALHKHSAPSIDLEGARYPLPCAFPGCAYGTEAESLKLAGRLFQRNLIWRGGPNFEWAIAK